MNKPTNKRRDFVNLTKEISIRHFEETASEYDAIHGSIETIHEQSVNSFLSRLKPNSVILDAACGTGKYFKMLASKADKLIGMDQSQAMLAKARQKWPEVETRCLALQELHTCDDLFGAFHGVVCIDALEWVMRDDWPAVLRGFQKILVPEGLLYITIEIPGDEERRALASVPEQGAAPEEIAVDYWYNHFPDLDEVLIWASQYGFQRKEHHECAHYHHLLLYKS